VINFDLPPEKQFAVKLMTNSIKTMSREQLECLLEQSIQLLEIRQQVINSLIHQVLKKGM
jgi:hypothetical protein